MARYIDADKLLEELQEEIEYESPMYSEERNRWFNIGSKCAVRDVKHQPIAHVMKVKHGEWTDAYISGVHHYRCTNCGEYIEATWTSNFDYNYCPNCGADMRGKTNG